MSSVSSWLFQAKLKCFGLGVKLGFNLLGKVLLQFPRGQVLSFVGDILI